MLCFAYVKSDVVLTSISHRLRTDCTSRLDLLAKMENSAIWKESRESFAKRLRADYPSFWEITWIKLEAVLGGEVSISPQKQQQLLKHLSSELRQKRPFGVVSLVYSIPFHHS